MAFVDVEQQSLHSIREKSFSLGDVSFGKFNFLIVAPDSYGSVHAYDTTGCNWRHFIMIEKLPLQAIQLGEPSSNELQAVWGGSLPGNVVAKMA